MIKNTKNKVSKLTQTEDRATPKLTNRPYDKNRTHNFLFTNVDLARFLHFQQIIYTRKKFKIMILSIDYSPSFKFLPIIRHLIFKNTIIGNMSSC